MVRRAARLAGRVLGPTGQRRFRRHADRARRGPAPRRGPGGRRRPPGRAGRTGGPPGAVRRHRMPQLRHQGRGGARPRLGLHPGGALGPGPPDAARRARAAGPGRPGPREGRGRRGGDRGYHEYRGDRPPRRDRRCLRPARPVAARGRRLRGPASPAPGRVRGGPRRPGPGGQRRGGRAQMAVRAGGRGPGAAARRRHGPGHVQPGARVSADRRGRGGPGRPGVALRVRPRADPPVPFPEGLDAAASPGPGRLPAAHRRRPRHRRGTAAHHHVVGRLRAAGQRAQRGLLPAPARRDGPGPAWRAQPGRAQGRPAGRPGVPGRHDRGRRVRAARLHRESGPDYCAGPGPAR